MKIMGTGFSKKKKQARMMQDQLSKMQGNMEGLEVTGSSGNGLVTVTLVGDFDMKSIHIKPECVDKEDIDGLQDLVKAAYQDAKKQLSAKMSANMPKMF
jgi:DNA-binding YbaB/EbfC family protein